MIDQEWIDDIEKLLLSDDEFSISSIKKMLINKYERRFGTIVIDNMLSILFLKYNLNKNIAYKILTVRSSR